MAEASLSINTHLPSTLTKRGRSQDSRANSESIDSERESQESYNGNMPPFLRLSRTEIHNVFEELEWLQRTRMSEGYLAKDASNRWALEAGPEVKARNRYVNVQAWANSRIHLKVPENQCDFINASPVTLKESKSGAEVRYIATQGPKHDCLADFWNMVFHETGEVGVIIMLTQTMEGGREKCAEYFPLDMEDASFEIPSEGPKPFVEDGSGTDEEDTASDEGDSDTDHNILGRVQLVERYFDEDSRSDIRKLELTFGSKSKTVWHFLFGGWPDYSKPEGENRRALLELIKLTAEKAGVPENPRIVHCSAGVGRTGTFIAIDYLLRELESGELLDKADGETDVIFETVNRLREQRMMMVYNEMQLQFIYEVLREEAEILLGQDANEDQTMQGVNLRSPKLLKLSSDTDFEYASKPELEPEPEPEPESDPIFHDTATSHPSTSFGTPEDSEEEEEEEEGEEEEE
ncbi:hypothetical protein FQN54_007237 [Arachnomyces sp. PD_36]|nr:hypothetical protein FQN54_007237 [Arachnomyces sp. PD_36]